MEKNNTITVIIPALNEEKRLHYTVSVVLRAVKRVFCDYEVIIFNDGSKDKTGEIADNLASKNENITVIHHTKPIGLGAVYKKGLKLSSKYYVILVNGKGDIAEDELYKVFILKDKADFIIPYTINISERSFFRRAVSRVFVKSLNVIFGLDIRYYNHYVLHKRHIINTINIHTNSYAFQAEAIIKLIKKGYSYIEVGVNDIFIKNIRTKAFKLKNIFGVAVFFFRLFFDIYIYRLLVGVNVLNNNEKDS